MKYSTFRKFKKDLEAGNFKEDSSIENDSIGSYEFWGEKCVDSQPDYVSGSIELLLDEPLEKEDLNVFIARYEDDIVERMKESDDLKGTDQEFERLQGIVTKKGCLIYLEYTATPDSEEEYEEDEDVCLHSEAYR